MSSSTLGPPQAFFNCIYPGDRELAASFLDRAETSGYSGLVLTVDTWALGSGPADLARGNFPQSRGFCMENYYSDENFTKHLAKPPHEDQAAALQYYAKIFADPLSWEDLRWIRSQTNLPIAVKGISAPRDARLRLIAALTCCTALITGVARRIRRSRRYSYCPGSLPPRAPPR